MNSQSPNPNPNPKEDDSVIDLTRGVAEPTADETEARVSIDDVVGKRLLIYGVEELPSRYGEGTYLRIHAQIETTGQKVNFSVSSTRGRDIVEQLAKLKSELDSGKKVRAVIIRERCVNYRYTFGVPPYERPRYQRGGGKK